MPVCRIMKENNYTRVSNHYLRDNSLSFKAKGLLTLMLSLPEDWDYTIAGLAQFTADGRVSIANTIRELEECGYICRTQTRDENGAFAQNVYWIYEVPQIDEPPCAENVETVDCASETSESAVRDDVDPMAATKSTVEISPLAGIEDTENRKHFLSVPSPILPIPPTEFPSAEIMPTGKSTQQIKELQKTEKQSLIRYDLMRARARERVEYAVLREEYPTELLNELIDLIVEMEACQSETMLIAGAVYPCELVASRMQSLNAECIRYVLDCLREVKPQIKNMKKYLMASLFNAPATMENFMESRVQREVFAKMDMKNTETGGIHA